MSDAQHRQEKDSLNRTLLTEGDFIFKEQIDLNNCDKEPIHIPGLIQPHGVLLAMADDENRTIIHCSRNVEPILGVSAEQLLGQPLGTLLSEDQLEQVAELSRQAFEPMKLHYLDFKLDVAGIPRNFYGILHASGQSLILELEPAAEASNPAVNDFEWIQTFFSKIKQAGNRLEASQLAAEQVKDILGYDRVMIYEFDEQWNGKVIAEAKEGGMEPFLGHHYPASDIPKQARELYLRNWLRTIVDVHYTPVEIVPTLHPAAGQPLNLSLSILRSVSPLHIEYLQNMGVGATMTISLIHENKLWGLITCHHNSPKYVPHRVRNLCNFLGIFFSSELYQRQQLDSYQSELRIKTLTARLSNIFIGNVTAARVMEQLQED